MVTVAAYKIIVVDDKEKARSIYKGFLEKKGFDVEVCANGEEALAKVKTFNPHCILLDLKMPGMSGLEFLKTLRKEANKTKVIILTGVTDIKITEECHKLGISDFIKKPIEFDYLNYAILEAVKQV